MKALEFLKSARIDTPVEWKELEEAIAELEELVAPKTCDGCIVLDDITSLSPNYIEYCCVCSRSCNDNYKPKETK